ncbi:Enterobactin exporter EntS [Fundidesulfovibrio magnetotacticus]|uniref:Enterobactin exporter EntS n=1 Tax=Fundidesulfovibrio magnetotacticus TaxID=2730080 RepID=A0A6V8LUX2_9BACT|nr:MFS transporter [Fundidesulfovibrio magnetotacticus]GFK93616.1 Enterobactin exporter EntS [Fundidesulfovibrio magnetotacticus]
MAAGLPEQGRGAVWRTLSRSLRHRDYRLFFTGQLISLVGTWMQQVAQGWLVYRLTGSSLSLGLVGFAGQFPVFLFSLLGGVAADRFDRRALLVWTQAASMVQAGLMAWLAFSGRAEVWQVLCLAFFLGTVNAVDVPTRQSFMVELVGLEDLHNAIALNSSLFNTARIVGPSVAGFLLAAVGEGWCFTLNALSFLAVIACLLRMTSRRKPAPEAGGSVWERLREGLAFAWGEARVRLVLCLVTAASVTGVSYVVLMPVFARDVLGGGPGNLGLLMASAGAGSLAAALTLAARGRGRGVGRFAYFGMTGLGASLALFANSESFALSAALLVPVGYCTIASMASCNTILQLLSPDRLRGRVMALYSMMFLGMAPFGALLAGSLAQLLGAPAAVTACGLTCLAVSAVAGRGLLRL